MEPQALPIGRILLLGLGWLCIGLGLAGAFLPLLPTTPFLLVALWAFGRSSPRFAGWVRAHPVLGPYVSDWEAGGAIRPGAKVAAILLMAASLAWLALWLKPPVPVTAAVALVQLAAAVFILTRPNWPAP